MLLHTLLGNQAQNKNANQSISKSLCRWGYFKCCWIWSRSVAVSLRSKLVLMSIVKGNCGSMCSFRSLIKILPQQETKRTAWDVATPWTCIKIVAFNCLFVSFFLYFLWDLCVPQLHWTEVILGGSCGSVDPLWHCGLCALWKHCSGTAAEWKFKRERWKTGKRAPVKANSYNVYSFMTYHHLLHPITNIYSAPVRGQLLWTMFCTWGNFLSGELKAF